jgi:hypothetical protein
MARKDGRNIDGVAKFHLPKNKCERIVVPKSEFDKRSFRWVKTVKGGVLIGCENGKWDAGKNRCKVGTRAHAVIVRKVGGACDWSSRAK